MRRKKLMKWDKLSKTTAHYIVGRALGFTKKIDDLDLDEESVSFCTAGITPLQIMKLAYQFETEPQDIMLDVAYEYNHQTENELPWFHVLITNYGIVKWEWKP